MKKAPEQIPTGPPTSFADLGRRFVRLGQAMQDESTKMREIFDLATSAGMEIVIKPGRKIGNGTGK